MLRHRHRWTIATLAAVFTLGCAAVLLGIVGAIGRGGLAPAAAAPAAQEQPTESPCVIVNRATVAPDIVLKGESVGVTLTVQASCPAVTPTIHIALVLDGSAAMSGQPDRQQKASMRALVQRLDLDANPGIQVGVVSHANGSATTLCQLSNRSGTVNGCIGRVGSAGAPDLPGALDEARGVLTRGRAGFGSPDSVREIVFVASGAAIAGNGCSDVQRGAGQIKSQGILLMTACAGPSCEQQCLRQSATNASYYFDDLDDAAIGNAFDTIIRQVGGPTLIRQMIVTETLGAGVELIADSAQPSPNDISPDGSTLVWRTAFVPREEGITFTFQARPSRLGPQTLGNATGSFTDSNDLGGRFLFFRQSVMVLAPDPVSTSTPEGTVDPGPSATPTPSDTSTPPPEDTPTPTKSPDEHHLYLPIVLLNHEC